MKTIKLIDGIPSEVIQDLEESILEILEGLDRHNASIICGIIDRSDNIEEIENKLSDEFYHCFKATLEQNGYEDLLTEEVIRDCASNYVKTYVVN